jgi:hypothetical protein
MMARDFNKIFLAWFGLYSAIALKVPKVDLKTIW